MDAEQVRRVRSFNRAVSQRIGAVRRFRRYLNGGRAHQPLDLRHRRDQAISLRDAKRGQNGFCERVGTTIKLSHLAQPGPGQSHPTNAAVVRRRLRSHQPLTLERAQEATDVTGIQLQSRAQIAHFRAGAPDFVEEPRFPEWTVAIEKMA